LKEQSGKRPHLLFYALNTLEEATFREEIEALTHTLKLEVVYVLQDPSEKWNGESGYITKEILDRQTMEKQLVRRLSRLGYQVELRPWSQAG
jgi:3-phenylpropionate/trans-cinnamate dioxygenase ferredoxin reductase subunit